MDEALQFLLLACPADGILLPLLQDKRGMWNSFESLFVLGQSSF